MSETNETEVVITVGVFCLVLGGMIGFAIANTTMLWTYDEARKFAEENSMTMNCKKPWIGKKLECFFWTR